MTINPQCNGDLLIGGVETLVDILGLKEKNKQKYLKIYIIFTNINHSKIIYSFITI